MNATATVRVVELTEPAELYRRYDGEITAQPAYIELDLRNGTLLASYNAEIGNAVPFSVHHGFERRWDVSQREHLTLSVPTADAANAFMKRIAPLADRILADWEEYWDGNNHVARLGEDALAAEEAIEALVDVPWDEADLVAVWDVDGATNGDEVTEYGITADTTDERLDEIEEEIRVSMAGAGEGDVVVLDGVDTYLGGLRDELKAEAAEAEDSGPTPDCFSISLDRTGFDDGTNWAEEATEQWIAEAERLGFGIRVESEEVPNPERQVAIVRRDDETLWVINIHGDDTLRAEVIDGAPSA
ncbi:hypothetical protein [Embleya sp. NPDC005971]|uniref:hypothetical protein n=1 Tax=Embleya sp. NPDC005971 TaxID=3156724 RepID=UPI00340BBFB2